MEGQLVFVIFLAANAFFWGGCSHLTLSPDPNVSLNPAFTFDASRAFQRALQAGPGSWDLERARIDYLFEQVSKSPYQFIRNESRYTGRRAEVHLRWKYFRNRGRVKTAEEFINVVASRSKRTGLEYQVEFPGKRRYPLRTLLLRELGWLDEEIHKKRKLLTETA